MSIVLAGSVLGGCALGTAIDTSRVGDECIQHSYSRNFWWPNWDRVGVLEVDANGACVHRKEMHTVTARESFGQGATKGMLGNAPIGAGLSLMRIQQSTGGLTINEKFSTKFIEK
jgi:hypothetical protein